MKIYKKICFIMLICFLVLLGVLVSVQVRAENWVDEINKSEFKPQLVYGFKEAPYTPTNKAFAVGAVLAGVFDIWSTRYAFDNNPNTFEMNGIIGDDPSVGKMIIVKVVVGVVIYYVVEYVSPVETRQTWRNWAYGSAAVTQTVVGLRNIQIGKK